MAAAHAIGVHTLNPVAPGGSCRRGASQLGRVPRRPAAFLGGGGMMGVPRPDTLDLMARIAELAATGLTLGGIALALTHERRRPFTRSAVAGLINRARAKGISIALARAEPVRLQRDHRVITAVPPREARRARVEAPALVEKPPRPVPVEVPPRREPVGRPLPLPPVTPAQVAAPGPEAGREPLACRYIYGAVADGPVWCNRATAPGTSWCPGHRAMVYVVAPGKRQAARLRVPAHRCRRGLGLNIDEVLS